MKISIVVPTYNRKKIVMRTLESIFSQNINSHDYEVIVVVDGSTDGTAEALQALRPTCKFRVLVQENLGISGARNTGYRAAQTDLVLFLDDDMICDPGLVGAHLAAHNESARIVAFGSVLLSVDSPSNLASECFEKEVGAFHLERKHNPEAKWQMKDCIFGNASLPRTLLVECGGFDEKFRMREDLEIGIRLFNIGADPRYVEGAIAYQYYAKNVADLIRDAEAFAVSDVLLAQKHPEFVLEGQLTWMARERRLKQRLLWMISKMPEVVDWILAPVCSLGEMFFQIRVLRKMGVRAVQIRRRIHWFHTVMEMGWIPMLNGNR